MGQQYDKTALGRLIYSPADLATGLTTWAEQIQTEPGVQFQIPEIDRVIIPARPGRLAVVCARPGHGKSSLLAYLAKTEATRIMQHGDPAKEAVVYISWESSAEELAGMFLTAENVSYSDVVWGKVDLKTLRYRAQQQVQMPVWVIGYGMGRSGRKLPRLTIDVIAEALDLLYDQFEVKATLVLADYIQIVPLTGRFSSRVDRITEVPFQLKEIAARFGFPIFAASQAGRQVDGRKEKIPELSDHQWASSMEQSADLSLALWRPWQTESRADHDDISLGGQTYPLTQQLFVLRMLKQRGFTGRHTWALHFDMEYLKLAGLESDAGQHPLNFE